MSFIAPFAASYSNLTVTYIGTSTSGNTFSFTFPAADPNRWLVAVVAFQSSGTPTVTIGGVSASAIGSIAANTTIKLGIFAANVPSNADQTVVLSAGTFTACSLYSLTGVSVLHTQDYTYGGVPGSTSTTFNVPAGAAILGGANDNIGSGVLTFTWSGLTKDTSNALSSNYYFSSASANFLAANLSQTVSVTASVTLSGSSGGAIKFVMFTPS